MPEVLGFKSGKDVDEDDLDTEEPETMTCLGCSDVASDQVAYESAWQLDPPVCPNCLRWAPVDGAACCAEGAPRERDLAESAAPYVAESIPDTGGSRTEITIDRYRMTRFWAVYEAGILLCVTVYKKGALAVQRRLQPEESTAKFMMSTPREVTKPI